MDSFRELANLCADVVAEVEDSKEARPAVRPYSGRNCYAGLASFESSTLATTSALRLASSEKVWPSLLLARHGECGRAGSFEMLTVLGIQEDI